MKVPEARKGIMKHKQLGVLKLTIRGFLKYTGGLKNAGEQGVP